jgi:hypothetical protein
MPASPVVVTVDKVHGTDRPGSRPDNDNYTIAPYLTIANAVSAARAGDVIEIMPGVYDEYNYFKTGVTFRTRGGVTLLNTRNDYPMLSDENVWGAGGEVVCDFIGPFLFKDTQTPATSGRNHGMVQLTRAGSRVRLFDIIGMSSETTNTTGNPCCVHVSAGTVEVHGAGTYLDSQRYDPVIMKPSGTGIFRANIDRLRADILATGLDGNCLEIGSGNFCYVTCNDATSGGNVAMRLNGTCDINVRNWIRGFGGITTSTGAVVRVSAYGIEATGDLNAYAVLHGAGTLVVDARRVVCTATDDVAVLVNASGLKMLNTEVVVSAGAAESIGVGGDPMSVLFRNCFSNKALHGDITALIAGNYTVDSDIA